MKKMILLGLVIGLMPLASYAQKKGDSESATPDTSDGCGLGWQITQKHSLLATTTRGTTNAVVPNTFGMSSGTIGCDQHTFAKKDVPAVKYAVTNYEPLAVEMAQGQGEYLEGLARTMGCDDGAVSDFGKMTQSHYRSLMGKNPVQMFENVKKEMNRTPSLVGRCNAA